MLTMQIAPLLKAEKDNYDAHLLNMANPHAITTEQIGAVPINTTINGKTLSDNITLSASDVSAVPTTRTINGKSLSSNITLSASDVGFEEPAVRQIVAPDGVIRNSYFSVRFTGGLFYCKRGKFLEIFTPYVFYYWNNTTMSTGLFSADSNLDFFTLPSGYYNYDIPGDYPPWVVPPERKFTYNLSKVTTDSNIPRLCFILAGSTLRFAVMGSNSLPDFNILLEPFQLMIPLK